MCSDISKAFAVDFIVASRVPGEIFASVVSNALVMRRERIRSFEPKSGLQMCAEKSQLHRVQLSANVNGVTFWSP